MNDDDDEDDIDPFNPFVPFVLNELVKLELDGVGGVTKPFGSDGVCGGGGSDGWNETSPLLSPSSPNSSRHASIPPTSIIGIFFNTFLPPSSTMIRCKVDMVGVKDTES